MKFKSHAQRKAVMASLNTARTPTSSSSVPYNRPPPTREQWYDMWEDLGKVDPDGDALLEAQILANNDKQAFMKRYHVTESNFDVAKEELDEANDRFEQDMQERQQKFGY